VPASGWENKPALSSSSNPNILSRMQRPWKSLTLTALLALASAAGAAPTSPSSPTTEGFGIGVVIGEPSGITASLPVGANNAFNLTAGYGLSHHGGNLTLLGNYVWHQRDLITVDAGKISLYYGPGARVLLARNSEVGLGVTLGIDYLFEGAPLQAYLEVCPGINVVPNTETNATAGIGLRYFF
jgi:hypothetical protein